MFSLLRVVADRLGVYDRMRYSWLYEKILRLRNPEYCAHLKAESAFYGNLFGLRRPGLIFDIGANFGDKASVFTQLSERVVCVEPDPRAVAALKSRFRGRSAVSVIARAMGANEGRLELLRQAEGSAYNSLSAKHAQLHRCDDLIRVPVEVGTLDSLIEKYGVPDFLKVDVEGFEDQVFAGLSQPIPLLCFEANLPEFKEETFAVIDRLVSIQPEYRFNAATNDQARKWAFETWETAGMVKAHVEAIHRGSADVYARIAN